MKCCEYGPCTLNLITAVTNNVSHKARMLVNASQFRARLMFIAKLYVGWLQPCLQILC
jgi:hypothetical protein